MSDIRCELLEIVNGSFARCPKCGIFAQLGSPSHKTMKATGSCTDCNRSKREQGRKDDSQNIAASILQDAIDAMSERGKSYDTDGKGVERSMDKVVAMFNTLTGHTLTTEQGWDFMILLKLVRASQGYKHDNYIDGSAYFGLAGEAASEADDD